MKDFLTLYFRSPLLLRRNLLSRQNSLPLGEDLLFYACMGLWLATNLCSIRPLKAKAQPAAEVEEIPQPTENPAVDSPIAEADPVIEEKPLASYAQILSQLEQE